MTTKTSTAPTPPHRIHVEGRTPGSFGKAPMITLVNGVPSPSSYVGSHHEAVYLSAIVEMADALALGHDRLAVTSPSELLVHQMDGTWEVGDELRAFHALAHMLAERFKSISWSVAPQTP